MPPSATGSARAPICGRRSATWSRLRPGSLPSAACRGPARPRWRRALAPELGSAPGAVHLRSDLERKSLFGVEETVRLPAQSYTPEASAEVYAIVLRKARLALAAGQSVIADAVYSTPEERVGDRSPRRGARRALPGPLAERGRGDAGRPRRRRAAMTPRMQPRRWSSGSSHGRSGRCRRRGRRSMPAVRAEDVQRRAASALVAGRPHGQ